MNRIGFLTELNASNNIKTIERNKSIDKLLDLVKENCEKSIALFETIDDSTEVLVKEKVKSFNKEQEEIRNIINCLNDYCSLKGIELKKYVLQFYSENKYLRNIFLDEELSKEENLSR